MPVGRMLREMSSHEITEWMVWFKLRNAEQANASGSGTTVQMNSVQTMAGTVSLAAVE